MRTLRVTTVYKNGDFYGKEDFMTLRPNNFVAYFHMFWLNSKPVLAATRVTTLPLTKDSLLFARVACRGRRFNRSIRRPQAVRTLTRARINSAHAVVKLHSEQPQ